MKILMVTTRLPFPPYKGDRLRIFNMAKYLAKRNEVKVIAIIRSKKEISYIDDLRKYNIEVMPILMPIWRSLVNIMLGLFSKKPFQVLWFFSSEMKKKVVEIISKDKPDVVFYYLIRGAQYFVENEKMNYLSVVDLIDAISLYLERFEKSEKNPLKRFLIKEEFKRVSEYEKISERFDAAILCSNFDLCYLKSKNIEANFKVIYNSVDDSFFNDYEPIAYDSKRISFIGNLSYFPNSDAVYFFTHEIFPQILKEEPEAKFYVVGQNPTRKMRRASSKEIIITGFVKEIKYEYLKSAVVVAPIRFGAGMQNKIVEALALGVPVVATSIAVNGLPDELKELVFVSDNSTEFAKNVITVIRDPGIRKQVQMRRHIVKEILGLDVIGQKLECYLKELLTIKIKKNEITG